MCYPIQEIKHRNIDYFIFSRAVILHSLQENVERIYCKMDGKINWLFIEQKPRFSGVSNEINSSA